MKWPKIFRKKQDLIREGERSAQSEIARNIFDMMNNQTLMATPTKKREVFIMDTPYKYQLNHASPRRKPDSLLDITTCRAFADRYDPLRTVIEHIKDEVCSVPIIVQPKDPNTDVQASQKRMYEAQQCFYDEGLIGGVGTRLDEFQRSFLEDVIVTGSMVAYIERDGNDQIKSVYELDSATIKPRVDAFGFADNENAYEQWIEGRIVRGFKADELIYYGIHKRSWSPYHMSSIELLCVAIITGMKVDEWNREWLISGDTPSDMMALPADWTPDQIEQFVDFWKTVLGGNTKERNKMRFVPSGSERVRGNTRKDQEFSIFEKWLCTRICTFFGVHPSELGWMDINAGLRNEPESRFVNSSGAKKFFKLRKDLFDRILRGLGYDDLETADDVTKVESAAARGQRLMVAVGGPWKSVNEGRKEDGLPPMSGQDEIKDISRDPGGGENANGQGKKNGADAKVDTSVDKAMRSEALHLYSVKASRRLKRNQNPSCSFVHDGLSTEISRQIEQKLMTAKSESDIFQIMGSYINA